MEEVRQGREIVLAKGTSQVNIETGGNQSGFRNRKQTREAESEGGRTWKVGRTKPAPPKAAAETSVFL